MESEKKAKIRRGVVVSKSGDKSIKVQIDYTVKHPFYGKYIKRRTRLGVHDEKNTAGMGDVVDLDHKAVWKDIDEYEREFGKIDRWTTFNKIIQVFCHMQIKNREWAELEEEKKKQEELKKKVGNEEAEEFIKNSTI